jgi:hypothetical protein
MARLVGIAGKEKELERIAERDLPYFRRRRERRGDVPRSRARRKRP